MSAQGPDRHDEAWIDRTRAALDEAAAGLDASTLSRLNRARQAALENARPRARRPAWIGAGVTALAAALVLAVGLRTANDASRLAPPASVEAAADFELLSSDDSLDLVEDQEFYAWLDAQSPSSG